jgi:hypothetical protein
MIPFGKKCLSGKSYKNLSKSSLRRFSENFQSCEKRIDKNIYIKPGKEKGIVAVCTHFVVAAHLERLEVFSGYFGIFRHFYLSVFSSADQKIFLKRFL